MVSWVAMTPFCVYNKYMVTITTDTGSSTARTIQDGIRYLTDALVAMVGYSEVVARSMAKKAISRSIDHKSTILVAYVNSSTISVTAEYKGILS